MIKDNAFHRLGLPATASSRAIRRALDEFGVLSDLGQGADLPDREGLSEIRQALEDPVNRLRQELLWLHSSSETVSPDIRLDDAGQVESASDRLRIAAGRGATRGEALALHDLAVLTFAHEVEEGFGADAAKALECWAGVLGATEFWRYMEERALAAGDPRLTSALIDELRVELPTSLLAVVADQAAGLIDVGDLERAGVAVRSLRRSGLPESDVEAAVRRAVSPLRARLEAGIVETRQSVGGLGRSEGDSPANRRKFEEAQSLLLHRVMVPVERLRQVDSVMGDPTIADRAADQIRQLSVIANNVLRDWGVSYLLARYAFGIGRTAATLAKLARDQATVAAAYHHDEADKATKARQPLQAAAHLRLAADFADDAELREQWLSVARGAQIHGRLSDDQVDEAKRLISAGLASQDEELRTQIERAAAGPEFETTSSSGLRTAPPVVHLPPPPRVQAQQPSSGRRQAWSSGRKLAFGSVLVVALIGGVAWLAAGNSSDSTVQTTAEPPRGSYVARNGVDWWRDASGKECLPKNTSYDTQGMRVCSAAAPATPAPEPEPVVQPVVSACDQLETIDASLDSLDSDITDARAAVDRLDNRSFADDEFEAFLDAHPEQNLNETDYAEYTRLKSNYDSYTSRRKALVRSVNSLVDTYNTKLRRYKRLSGEC